MNTLKDVKGLSKKQREAIQTKLGEENIKKLESNWNHKEAKFLKKILDL